MLKRLWSRIAKAGSNADAAPHDKKQKQTVFSISVTVVAPEDVSPVTLVLDAANESIRAAQQAKQKTTSVKEYRKEKDYPDFAKKFEAAVASAFAKEEKRPVSLNRVITEMMDTGCEPKIRQLLKERWSWRGFKEDRWQISRHHVSVDDLVVFPKDAPASSQRAARSWRFSPSPAARRPLAGLSK